MTKSIGVDQSKGLSHFTISMWQKKSKSHFPMNKSSQNRPNNPPDYGKDINITEFQHKQRENRIILVNTFLHEPHYRHINKII